MEKFLHFSPTDFTGIFRCTLFNTVPPSCYFVWFFLCMVGDFCWGEAVVWRVALPKKKKKEDDKLLTAVSLRLQFNLVCYAQLTFFSSSPTVTNAQFSVSSILVAAFFINSSNPSSVSWLQEGYSPFPTPPRISYPVQ